MVALPHLFNELLRPVSNQAMCFEIFARSTQAAVRILSAERDIQEAGRASTLAAHNTNLHNRRR